jgi:hypothetical protein
MTEFFNAFGTYFFLVKRNGDELELSACDQQRKVTSLVYRNGEIRQKYVRGDRFRVHVYGDLSLVESITPKLSDDIKTSAEEAARKFLIFEHDSPKAEFKR